MHISAAWGFNPGSQIRAVNVEAHRNPRVIHERPEIARISEQSTKDDIVAKRYELKPGGNRLEASLDLVFDDDALDPLEINKQLRDVAMSAFRAYDPIKPIEFERNLGSGLLYGRFDVYLGPLESGSARAVFSLLSKAIAMLFYENRSLFEKRPAA